MLTMANQLNANTDMFVGRELVYWFLQPGHWDDSVYAAMHVVAFCHKLKFEMRSCLGICLATFRLPTDIGKAEAQWDSR